MAGDAAGYDGETDVESDVHNDTDEGGEELTEAVLEELAAVADAEAVASEAEQAAEAEQIASAERQLEVQRGETRTAVARYREAVLAAEPQLPPELVSGETLNEVDASLEAARRSVAQIRERLSAEREEPRGFPVGAPARGGVSAAAMTSAEKIAYGLEQRSQAS